MLRDESGVAGGEGDRRQGPPWRLRWGLRPSRTVSSLRMIAATTVT